MFNDFSRAIDGVYDAVEAHGFTALPAALTKVSSARSATLQLTDNLLRPFAIASDYFPESFVTSYVSDAIFDCDPWADILREHGMRERAINCDDHTSHRRFLSSRLWNDLIVQIGDDTGHCMGFGTMIEPGVTLTAGLHRPIGNAFGPREVAMLEAAMPHVRRAMRVRRKLDRNAWHIAATTASLDLTGLAIIVFGDDQRIIEASAAAERFLADRSIFGAQGGLSSCVDAQSHTALRAAVSAAIDRSGRRGGELVLRDGSGRSRLYAEVAPLTLPEGRSAATVILRESAPAMADRAARAAQLFALTPAEAEIAAAVGAGLTLDEIATQRATSLSTVKTLLGRCFRKTDTARQAELASLVAGLG